MDVTVTMSRCGRSGVLSAAKPSWQVFDRKAFLDFNDLMERNRWWGLFTFVPPDVLAVAAVYWSPRYHSKDLT